MPHSMTPYEIEKWEETAELGTLLAAARECIVCRDLCELAVQLGAEPHEALDIIGGLVADRLLISSR